MGYQLWDTASGNLVGWYATEGEALQVVADLVSRYKSPRGKRVPWLSLARTDVPPEQGFVAAGPDLVQRALGTPPAAIARPAPAARRRKRAAA